MEVIITVLEGEEDCFEDNGRGSTGDADASTSGWGLMSILSGCITVASAAIADAGVDCVDLVTGGVAAMVRQPNDSSGCLPHTHSTTGTEAKFATEIVMDPCPSEHQGLLGACVVGYLQSRDEITEIWAKGDLIQPSNKRGSEQSGLESLIDQAVEAASSARLVLIEALKESTELKIQRSKVNLQEPKRQR